MADAHSRRILLRLGRILGKSLLSPVSGGPAGLVYPSTGRYFRRYSPRLFIGVSTYPTMQLRFLRTMYRQRRQSGRGDQPNSFWLVEDTNRNRMIMRQTPDQTSSKACVRRSVCGSGYPILIESQTIGVGTSPREVQGNLLVVASSTSGSLRNPSQCQDQGVCVSSSVSRTSVLHVSALGPVVPSLCVSTLRMLPRFPVAFVI